MQREKGGGTKTGQPIKPQRTRKIPKQMSQSDVITGSDTTVPPLTF